MTVPKKVTAFITITGPVPTALMSRPAPAGPTICATLEYVAVIAEALGSSSGPTISLTNAIRAGVSTALMQPTARASRLMCHSRTSPARTSTARSSARPPAATLAATRSRRLS